MSDGPHNSAVMQRTSRRLIAAAALLPLVLLLLCGALAQLLPEDQIWPSAIKAGLLSLPRWVVLLWLPWGLWAWRRTGRWRGPLVVVLLTLPLSGVPALDAVQGPGLVVLAANVQAYSDDDAALEHALAAQLADLVLTFELRGHQVEGMTRVADNYQLPLSRPSHGSAVYCREGLDCQARITPEVGAPDCVMPISLVRAQGLCVVGMHPHPTVPLCATGLRPYVDHVASHIDGGRLATQWSPCQLGDPVLVVGDMNTVPGTDAMRALLRTGLRDLGRFRGVWGVTWPAGAGWPNLPFFRLDQALVGDMHAEGLRTLRLPDTDHKALRLRVRARP